jgi:signal transduction histidine kinase
LLNLLTNALKFNPSGGVSIRFERVERVLGGELSLVVVDTGIGIDPAALPKLGKAFMQADASTCRMYGGTGLGLAIRGRLVAPHDAALNISSTLGRGTTVRVDFSETRILRTQRQVAARE